MKYITSRIIVILLIVLFEVSFFGGGKAMGVEENTKLSAAILSKDFDTARRALEVNRKYGAVELVCQSLKHPSLRIKDLAVKHLSEMHDVRAVPFLVAALKDNQVKYTGGTETLVLQSELNRAIIFALKEITGLEFKTDEDDVSKIIRDVKKWEKLRKSEGTNEKSK